MKLTIGPTWALTLGLAACSAAPTSSGGSASPVPNGAAAAEASSGPAPCDQASVLRASVPELRAQGRLRRGHAALERADELCANPAGAELSRAIRAELDPGPGADGRALLASALAGSQNDAASRKSYDRALFALEREHADTARVVAPVAPTTPDEYRLSPDGTRLLAVDGGVVRVHDAHTGREVARLRGNSAVFVNTGKSVAVAIANGFVRVHSLATGAREKTLPTRTRRNPVLRADAAGTRIVAAGSRVELWDVTTGRPLLELDRDVGGNVALSADGRILAVETTIYDAQTGRMIQELPLEIPPTFRIESIALDPRGDKLAVSLDAPYFQSKTQRQAFERVSLIDIKTRRVLRTIPEHGEVAFVAADQLAVWSRASQPRIHALSGGVPRTVDACDSQLAWFDGHTLLCDREGRLTRHQLSGTLVELPLARKRHAASASLAFASRRVAVLRAESLRVFDLDGRTAPVSRKLPGAVGAALSPDAALLAVATESELQIVELSGDRVRSRIPLAKSDASDAHVIFSPNGRHVAVVRGGYTIVDLRSSQRLVGDDRTVAFSPDSRFYAVGGLSRIDVRDLARDQSVVSRATLEPAHAVSAVAFSHDSRRVFYDSNRALRVLDVTRLTPPELVVYQQASDLASVPSGALLGLFGGSLRALSLTTHHASSPYFDDLEPPLTTNRHADFAATSPEGVLVGNAAHPERAVTIGFTPTDGSAYALSADGRYQILDPQARELLACQVGPMLYPLALCAERFESENLLATIRTP